jgi:hypothetical protein
MTIEITMIITTVLVITQTNNKEDLLMQEAVDIRSETHLMIQTISQVLDHIKDIRDDHEATIMGNIETKEVLVEAWDTEDHHHHHQGTQAVTTQVMIVRNLVRENRKGEDEGTARRHQIVIRGVRKRGKMRINLIHFSIHRSQG